MFCLCWANNFCLTTCQHFPAQLKKDTNWQSSASFLSFLHIWIRKISESDEKSFITLTSRVLYGNKFESVFVLSALWIVIPIVSVWLPIHDEFVYALPPSNTLTVVEPLIALCLDSGISKQSVYYSLCYNQQNDYNLDSHPNYFPQLTLCSNQFTWL
jgi:hypothetical protein